MDTQERHLIEHQVLAPLNSIRSLNLGQVDWAILALEALLENSEDLTPDEVLEQIEKAEKGETLNVIGMMIKMDTE